MKKLIFYTIIIAGGIFFWPVKAQQKSVQTNLPRKELLKIRYTDLDTIVVLEDSVINLHFKDRPTDESFCTSFTVMLEVKNNSKQALYLPNEIVVYGDNAGFYDNYDMRRTELILPQKKIRIPITIVNTGHTQFSKEGSLRVFLEDSSFVRFPISTTVRFYKSDSMCAFKHH